MKLACDWEEIDKLDWESLKLEILNNSIGGLNDVCEMIKSMKLLE